MVNYWHPHAMSSASAAAAIDGIAGDYRRTAERVFKALLESIPPKTHIT